MNTYEITTDHNNHKSIDAPSAGIAYLRWWEDQPHGRDKEYNEFVRRITDDAGRHVAGKITGPVEWTIFPGDGSPVVRVVADSLLEAARKTGHLVTKGRKPESIVRSEKLVEGMESLPYIERDRRLDAARVDRYTGLIILGVAIPATPPGSTYNKGALWQEAAKAAGLRGDVSREGATAIRAAMDIDWDLLIHSHGFNTHWELEPPVFGVWANGRSHE